MPSMADHFAAALLRAARSTECDRVLVVGHAPSVVSRLKSARSKVICAVSDARHHSEVTDAGFAAVVIPDLRASRTDKLQSALVAAMNAGLIAPSERIMCALARDDEAIDLLTHLTASDVAADRPSLQVGMLQTRLPAPLLEVLADLALRIGREGYEGRPIGTLIVV